MTKSKRKVSASSSIIKCQTYKRSFTYLSFSFQIRSPLPTNSRRHKYKCFKGWFVNLKDDQELSPSSDEDVINDKSDNLSIDLDNNLNANHIKIQTEIVEEKKCYHFMKWKNCRGGCNIIRSAVGRLHTISGGSNRK